MGTLDDGTVEMVAHVVLGVDGHRGARFLELFYKHGVRNTHEIDADLRCEV